MKRSFEEIMETLRKSIASYDYYVDFSKVYRNISEIEISLNILNYLIGKVDNFDEEFKLIISKYPETLSVIPILLAVRKKSILVIDGELINYGFSKMTHTLDDYLCFVKKSGIKELLVNKHIKNLVDYVTGVEVGLDSNARKNRTGTVMENIVESFLEKVDDIEYLTQATKDEIQDKFNTQSLDSLRLNSEDGKSNKRFDFAVKNNNGHIYLIETNFYSSGGSKLNETARSYSKLASDIKNIDNVTFVWITDGVGWKTAKNNLHEAYGLIDHIYTLHDLERDAFIKLL